MSVPATAKPFVVCKACGAVTHECERVSHVYPCCGAEHRAIAGRCTTSARLTWAQARGLPAATQALRRWTLALEARLAGVQDCVLEQHRQRPECCAWQQCVALRAAIGEEETRQSLENLIALEQRRRRIRREMEMPAPMPDGGPQCVKCSAPVTPSSAELLRRFGHEPHCRACWFSAASERSYREAVSLGLVREESLPC